MSNLKPCPFCGESNGSLLAFGPVGATKEIRERKQATTCLSCGAEGPAVDRVDGLFTAAADAWNKREPHGAALDLREAARALLDQIDMMNNPARIGELANPSDEYGYFMILTGDLRKALEASNASPPKAEKSSPSEEKPIQNIAPTPLEVAAREYVEAYRAAEGRRFKNNEYRTWVIAIRRKCDAYIALERAVDAGRAAEGREG